MLIITLIFVSILIGNTAYEAGNISGAVLGLETLFGIFKIDLNFFSLNIHAVIIGFLAISLLWIGKYKIIERYLIGLVIIMSIAFFFTALATMPSLFDIIMGLFSFKAKGDSLLTIIGLVGTTIVPYNLFLHAELVKEKWTYPSDLKHALKDLIISLGIGGMISLSLAGDKNLCKHCNALIMVDIGINPNENGSNEILDFMRSGSGGFVSIEEASNAISEYLPHRQKPRDFAGLKKNLRLKHDGKYYWHWDPKFIDEISKDKIAYRKRLKGYAEFVQVPTLLIKGALSNVLTQKEVEDFLITIPHTEFVEIDKAAHMIAGDRNDIFANAVVSFLANLNRTR